MNPQDDIRNIIDYLNRFNNEHWDDIKAASVEFRPNRGYGNFYRSGEVYQLMFDIFSNVHESLLNLNIPGDHQSPKSLIKFIQNFYNYLSSKDSLFKDIYEHEKNIGPSLVVTGVDEIRHQLMDAFEYVLEFDEAKKYLNNENIGAAKEEVNYQLEKKSYNDPVAVLKNYDLEDLTFMQLFSLSKLKHIAALVLFTISIFTTTIVITKSFQRNEDVLESISDKKAMHELEDSVKYYKKIGRMLPLEYIAVKVKDIKKDDIVIVKRTMK